jgi:hypothetical protein
LFQYLLSGFEEVLDFAVWWLTVDLTVFLLTDGFSEFWLTGEVQTGTGSE